MDHPSYTILQVQEQLPVVPCGSDNLQECVSEELLMPPHHHMTVIQHQTTVILEDKLLQALTSSFKACICQDIP
jgi:hypothetical protein